MCMACDMAGVDTDDAFISGMIAGFLHLTESLPIVLCDVHKNDFAAGFPSLKKSWDAIQAQRMQALPQINTPLPRAGGAAN